MVNDKRTASKLFSNDLVWELCKKLIFSNGYVSFILFWILQSTHLVQLCRSIVPVHVHDTGSAHCSILMGPSCLETECSDFEHTGRDTPTNEFLMKSNSEIFRFFEQMFRLIYCNLKYPLHRPRELKTPLGSTALWTLTSLSLFSSPYPENGSWCWFA